MGLAVTIIILESIGFSATHSISDMLSMNGKNYVSHGSKNFRKRQKIGKSDLSFSEYFKEMQELQDEQANCISVHSVYSPALISQTVQGSCAKFYGLARRSQKDQILSCFFWAVNGFLNGRQDFNHHLAKVHTHFAGELNNQGLVSNFQNCLMLYAMRHVLKFNLELGLHSQKIFFMEDIVKDPNSLAIELKLIDEKHPPLTIHKRVSHKEKAEKFEFLGDANIVFETLVNLISINTSDKQWSFHEVENLLAHKGQICPAERG